MRYMNVLLLFRFYCTFIARRVLTRRVLASGWARAGFVAVGLATLGILTLAAYAFLRSHAHERGVMHLLLNLASLSAVLWVLIAFMFTKILFLKSERMLSLTFQLPVTGRERALALLLFEAVTVCAIVAVLFTSSIIPVLVLYGFSAVAPTLWALVFPVLSAYVLLNSGYMAMMRVLSTIRLERSRTLILLVVVALMSALYYGRVVEDTIAIANAYGSGAPVWSPPLAFTYLADVHGWYASVALFVVVFVAGAALSVALTAPSYVPSQSNVPIPLGPLVRIPGIGPQIALHIRSSEWILAAILSLVLGSVLISTSLAPAPLACGLLVLNGIGSYAFVHKCSWIRPHSVRRSLLVQYGSLIGAQLFALLPIVMILAVASLVAGAELRSTSFAAVGVLAGLIAMNAVGILFPPERDNPFSMTVGLAVFLAFSVLGILGVAALDLSGGVLALFSVVTLAFIVSISIVGMSINDQRSRYEESNPANRVRNRVSNRDSRYDSGRNLVRHVQYNGG